ncbi:hypothetical protein B9Z39_02180 [Limnohabitans sp. JirII-29]|uniref:Bug family tripartite tricarboxylate transporter substrate binding protein n=1 Tax=Limnohabitans sp. JirII-29 TaxID=1835756 RepID=UPI000D3B5D3E|nr:tripartite tricarboxylate transporter substrate binding protein [Limnohabitans sp. JirII-29]PUE30343.1 hypothetical protein B9Z39_02180 [Limnohabitans sp. JirII-29]
MTNNQGSPTRRLMVWACALSGLCAAWPAANAQDNPLSGKQIRLVAPFSPGGGVDTLARGLADGLQRNTGLSVTVENKPGAGGNIAANYVAKSSGNTLYLLVNSVNHYANPIMVKNSGYDPYKDFAPVAYLSSFPYIFVTPGDSKFTQLKEVTAQLRNQPGSVSWAFGGNGTLGHFLGVAMERAEKIKGTPVSYRGGPDLLTALGGKQVDMAIMSVQSSLPLIAQGRLKALAVSGDTRNKTLPQVPAANEVIANYPSIVGFVALYAPAHTPARQLEQLIREVNKVVTSEEYTKRLDKDGSTAKTFANASEAKDFFDKEGPKWEALTVEAGLKVE